MGECNESDLMHLLLDQFVNMRHLTSTEVKESSQCSPGTDNKVYDHDVDSNPGDSKQPHTYDASYQTVNGIEVVINEVGINPQKPVNSTNQALQKTMGYRQGFALMLGLLLGSGIFISPQLVAQDTSNTGMMLLTWVVSGVFAMMGSLCYCELGGIFKVAGGNYLNIFKIYGQIPAFLCAWTTCIIIDPSCIAAIALTIGLYLSKPFYATDYDAESTAKIIAFVVIVMTMLLHCMSSKYLNRVQSGLAVAQILAVGFVISLGIWQFSLGKFDNYHGMFNDTKLTTGVGTALFGALWSYDGWSCMNNVVEEMKNVERDLLLVVLTAFPVVIVCYLLVNLTLLTLLSRAGIAGENAVGVAFVNRALGPKASYFMMVIVGLSAYGTLNGTLFTNPRLTLAAAREGHMPKIFSFIHNKTKSPIPGTVLTCTVAILMLIPSMSDLNSLILLFSQAQWIIYGASTAGVVILRIRQPHLDRPYRVFIGFPILMSLVAVVLVVLPFFQRPFFSVGLFVFIIAGLPVYFIFVRYHEKLPTGFLKMMEDVSNKSQQYFGMVPCQSEDL